tara:strand:- start:2612 stop:3049 length:438 start_codon:yes stop_codon:yes gene_type:complete
MQLTPAYKIIFKKALEKSSLKPTKQREHIFSLILNKKDHPTADEIFTRSRDTMPSISLATVYNCLETLVESGLIRQVNFERESTRYCPNLKPHAHFLCKETGTIYDVDLPASLFHSLKKHLPKNFDPEQIDINFNGSIHNINNHS